MVDGEIQVHGGHNHDHKDDHAHDLAPVWPEGDSRNSHSEHDHSEMDHSEHDHSEHFQ